MSNTFEFEYHWVESHKNDQKSEDKQIVCKKGNMYEHILVDKALAANEQDNIFIDSDFLFEQLSVKTSPLKVTGSLHKAI